MRFRRPPKSTLWQLCAFAIFGWMVFAYSWYRYNTSLTDTDKLVAVLDRAVVEVSPGRANPLVVVLHLRNTVERPGIFVGASFDAAEALAAQFHSGDSLTVFYNASGMNAPYHVNLHTFQVATPKRVIYSIADAQRSNKGSIWGSGLLAVISTLLWFCLILLHRKATA